MVITVTCPSCTTSFPVDPAKIPEGGVSARCTQCNEVFRVEKPAPEAQAMEAAPAFEAPVAAPEPPVEAPAPAVPPPLPEPVAADPFAEKAPFEAPEPPAPEPVAPEPPPAFGEPAAPAPAAEAATPAEPQPVQGFTFGKRDPSDKARRLARVLVSDMIMYNAERHRTALAGGTLAADFEEEIEKSWKEFVDQVGSDIAEGEGRAYWTAALNDILAKGQQIF